MQKISRLNLQFIYPFAWIITIISFVMIVNYITPSMDGHARHEQGRGRGFDREAFLSKAQSLSYFGTKRASLYLNGIERIQNEAEPLMKARIAQQINLDLFNYASDMDVWTQVDYWASPLEFLDKGEGDCEDFAISAYMMLSASGIPKRKLRMAYVRLSLGGLVEPHMVLLVGDPGQYLVIDNTRHTVTALEERKDLELVFSFDYQNIYIKHDTTSIGSSMQRMIRWREAIERSATQGFQ